MNKFMIAVFIAVIIVVSAIVGIVFYKPVEATYPTGIINWYQIQTSLNAAFNPSNATTYYFGMSTQSTTDGAGSRIYIRRAGTIKKVLIIMPQTAGSAQTSSMYIRVNGTTDTLLTSTLTNNGATSLLWSSDVSIPVVANDYIQIKWVTPTWTPTLPTNVRLETIIYFE